MPAASTDQRTAGGKSWAWALSQCVWVGHEERRCLLLLTFSCSCRARAPAGAGICASLALYLSLRLFFNCFFFFFKLASRKIRLQRLSASQSFKIWTNMRRVWAWCLLTDARSLPVAQRHGALRPRKRKSGASTAQSKLSLASHQPVLPLRRYH